MDANLRVRVIVLQDDSLLLHPPGGADEGSGYWTLPGGGLESGETLAECAAREVQEETCVTVTVGDVAFLRERPWVIRHRDQPEENGLCLEIYFYAWPVGTDVLPRAEHTTAATPRWVSLVEAARLPLWPPELASRVEMLSRGTTAPSMPC